MKKLISSIVFLFAFVLAANACLNYYYTTFDKEGHTHRVEELLVPFNINFNKEYLANTARTLEKKLQKEHSFMLLSDYAVGLMKLGKTKEALDILVELSAKYPGEYKIASNLGTAYELNDEIDSALKYIRRGIKLNPKDHEGSEWIHVQILLTKKKMAADAMWLSTHSVLELDEKQKKDTKVRDQLLIQLQERFPFSPGPDAMMASMFIDLGDLYSNTSSVEYALACYEISKNYYGNKSEPVESKIKSTKMLVNKYRDTTLPEKEIQDGDRVEHNLLRRVNYKTLLFDNDKSKYEVDWDNVVYDPKTLLAMVNLDMSVKEAREEALKNPSGDLKLIADSTVTLVDVPATGGKLPYKSNAVVIILFSILGVAIVGLIAYKVVKSRRSN